MKRNWIIILFFAASALCAFYPPVYAPPTPEQQVADTLLAQVSRFRALLQGRFKNAVQQGATEGQLQQLFLESRLAYKQFEWAATYFDPAAAVLLNGAPVPEATPVYESGPGVFQVVEPQGLQVIEPLLFPHYDSSAKDQLLAQLQRMEAASQRYTVHFTNIDILGGQVFDAAKLEVYRVLTLGISGFDAPLSGHSLEASAAGLRGLRAAIASYTQAPALDLLDSAAHYLDEHPGFDAFDRAAFITRYGNPLSKALTRLQRQLNITMVRYPRLLRQDAETLFDVTAFDAQAYATSPSDTTGPAQVALGKRLFFDKGLSADLTRSCASCHQPDKAFADGLAKQTALDGKQLLARNTPTLLNAALQPAYFYDLRATTLQEQVRMVLSDPLEMHASLPLITARLRQDSTYQSLFAKAYPGNGVLGIDSNAVPEALAAYVRSLVALNSRFDDYMRGNDAALTRQEVSGFNLFMGKARCGTCHYMPLFNGVLPPAYSRMETEVIGVPAAVGSKGIDQDRGRGAIIPVPFLQHSFKTTTVRNAVRTAPYMHNGVYTSLEQVIDFYDTGGGAGSGWAVSNQTLSTDSLHLQPVEKAALIAFIRSLDSR